MSLDAVGIVSSDLNKTCRFYACLGIILKEAGGPDHLEAGSSSGFRLMADSKELMKKIHPDRKVADGGGVVLCFRKESPAEVDQCFNKITGEGFKALKEPWDAFWGQRYASVLDPDGNQIDLYAPL